jgi:hypothetical protein
MGTTISKNEKSILVKRKLYCADVGRLSERYFIYRVYIKDWVKYEVLLTEQDYPECKPYGLTSLRKAKMIHLLESI